MFGLGHFNLLKVSTAATARIQGLGFGLKQTIACFIRNSGDAVKEFEKSKIGENRSGNALVPLLLKTLRAPRAFAFNSPSIRRKAGRKK
jgi:hypothetical protein